MLLVHLCYMHTVQCFSLVHSCKLLTLHYFARPHIRKYCFLQRLLRLRTPPPEQQTRSAKTVVLPATSGFNVSTSGRQCFKAVGGHPQARISVTVQHFLLGERFGDLPLCRQKGAGASRFTSGALPVTSGWAGRKNVLALPLDL